MLILNLCLPVNVHEIIQEPGVGVLVMNGALYRIFRDSPALEVAGNCIEIFPDFPLHCKAFLPTVFLIEIAIPRLNAHRLEYVHRQQHPDFFVFVIVIIFADQHRAPDWVAAQAAGDVVFKLLTRL